MSLPSAEQPILSVMLGTAGHVDHGKTALVRNLTGFDTDRHPEERARGVSIDFAVAPFPLPDGRVAGIIDVPGHEDFIRNMVAGASAIDLLLLIVAADDAVMPQTEEHLRIAKVLGISAVIGVITKIDLVTPEILEIVETDVESFLSKSGFAGAPIVCVSNVTRAGFETLLAQIVESLSTMPARLDQRSFRMPIRQIFTAKGHGIIVTGVPVSGILRVDDPVEILPTKTPSSVRGIQNYRRSNSAAEPHRSTAVNLRLASGAEQITRGMVLAAPGAYISTEYLVAWFCNHSKKEVLNSRHQVLFHSGTFVGLARTRLLDCQEVNPGGEGFLRLKFERPVSAAAGDRFVLRNVSNNVTYGGGRVLAVHIGGVRRLTEAYFDCLIQAKDAVERGEYLRAELLVGTRLTFSLRDLHSRAQLDGELFESEVRRLVSSGELIDLGEGGWVVAARKNELLSRIARTLRHYHQINRAVWGMKPAYVCEVLTLPPECFRKLEPILLESQELEMKHGRLALASFQPQINAREIRLRDDLLKLVEHVGIQSIARGSLLDELKTNDREIRPVIKLLTDEGHIVLLGNNFFARTQIERCKKVLRELFRTHSVVEIAHFREATGASRNAATLILDAFDSEGFTRRTEQGRVLVKKK